MLKITVYCVGAVIQRKIMSAQGMQKKKKKEKKIN